MGLPAARRRSRSATRAAPSLRIRSYKRSDRAAFLALVLGLAEYEKLAPPSPAAQRRLVADIGRRIHVLLAETEGRAVGYAIYLFTYSSFRARPTLYLEDLFVVPEARRRGVGRAFFRALKRAGARVGCARMEWVVLRWNRTAIRFYERLGAQPLEGWLTYRLALKR